jgi:hypothetical protein
MVVVTTYYATIEEDNISMLVDRKFIELTRERQRCTLDIKVKETLK